MRPLSLMLAAAVIGMALFEVMMQPSPSDRLELGSIFGAMAILMAGAVRLLPIMARRLRSIRVTMAFLALAAFSIVVGGAVAVGSRMFLSSHDLTLLIVVLGFGVLSALIFAFTVSRPLVSDLDRLSDKATHVADGVLEPGFYVDRRDEVGRLGIAVNQMIEDLEKAEAARRSNEEARRVFLSSVGHDLRTPLASLRASVEAIEDGVLDEPEQYLKSMERDVEVLTRLVEDINLLARLDSGAFEFRTSDVDITEIADEAMDVLRPLAVSRHISLRLIAGERVMVKGHPEHVGRALRNLIDNAVRHAPDSSEVIVDVSRRNGSAVVTVADQGRGFDAEFVPSAFDRFTRADPARVRETGGSGLGLAIVRGLISALDGRVWIEPGPGGRVGIELPAADTSVDTPGRILNTGR